VTSRVEQLNKTYHSQVLVSETAWKTLKGNNFPGEDLGLVEIRGHEDTIRLYKLA